MSESTNKLYGTVLIRAKEILDYLLNSETAPTLKEISDGIGMTKPTTLKILTTLEALKFVTRDENTKAYFLDVSLLAYGEKASEEFDIRSIVTPTLSRLRDSTGETINLGIVNDNEIVLLDKFESPQSIFLKSRIGGRMNMYSSSMGKAILSAYSDTEMADYLDHTDLKKVTPNTITTSDALIADLQTTKGRGYSVDDEENEVDIFCVGFVITKYQKIYGAFSITAPKFRMGSEKRKKIVQLAKEAQKEIIDKI
ncbi:IclR family transcriptional regulator [Furfurilactobacillus rossiae]|uniref:Transcriptional regulator n=1 Tax=Furfurilactobacillus rossiae DSM 15814 TaxID=1114972 RepID=A0A0R1RM88_9LACO|nr:IclR family transcriptional regulator [Furfurilactobacillus rossiae]KRL54504.1 transcriptional regulator [Furfurilactobacillus rossiae DSM 15814]QFR67380.1 helix-turn-helix domain-containing protein [Furfurilactobacillus rossiae]QLE60320.1 Transcriptional regulator IclR [Furfurilactobacillus rossiae]